ncbi:hypothetical protein CDAR_164171 [Caerostris darwini]|uniref:Uncharacterized protein n=1 Tax=Caerostris darwini TaxID=1538125 RepID=A0AAV4X8A6_9ARAC|nr:hypothetical protein CDAR_164171 [Caerostris darwini]
MSVNPSPQDRELLPVSQLVIELIKSNFSSPKKWCGGGGSDSRHECALDPLLKEGIRSPSLLSECDNFCLSDADFSMSLRRRQKCLKEGIGLDLMARIKEIFTLGGGWGSFWARSDDF